MKECKICHITISREELQAYNNICPVCHTQDSFIDEYVMDIRRISSDEDFINAMIKLHNENPIEYQLKMQQFKTQLQQQKQMQQVIHNTSMAQNTPRCPTCNSTKIKKISGISKAGSIAVWGIFSRKMYKQWHCDNCGSEW